MHRTAYRFYSSPSIVSTSFSPPDLPFLTVQPTAVSDYVQYLFSEEKLSPHRIFREKAGERCRPQVIL